MQTHSILHDQTCLSGHLSLEYSESFEERQMANKTEPNQNFLCHDLKKKELKTKPNTKKIKRHFTKSCIQKK